MSNSTYTRNPSYRITEKYSPQHHILLPELCARWGIGGQALWRQVHKKSVPMPITKNGPAAGWSRAAITQMERPQNSGNPPPGLFRRRGRGGSAAQTMTTIQGLQDQVDTLTSANRQYKDQNAKLGGRLNKLTLEHAELKRLHADMASRQDAPQVEMDPRGQITIADIEDMLTRVKMANEDKPCPDCASKDEALATYREIVITAGKAVKKQKRAVRDLERQLRVERTRVATMTRQLRKESAHPALRAAYDEIPGAEPDSDDSARALPTRERELSAYDERLLEELTQELNRE